MKQKINDTISFSLTVQCFFGGEGVVGRGWGEKGSSSAAILYSTPPTSTSLSSLKASKNSFFGFHGFLVPFGCFHRRFFFATVWCSVPLISPTLYTASKFTQLGRYREG